MMHSRRNFLAISVTAGVLLNIGVSASFAQTDTKAIAATAVTEVFGDGIRLIAVAIEYTQAVKGDALTTDSFTVENRVVTGAFTSTSANPADRADEGAFVIVTLSPDDAAAPLADTSKQQGPGDVPPQSNEAGGPPAGVGNAGDIPDYDTTYAPASATIVQTASISFANGTQIDAIDNTLTTTAVKNLIVDDFQQLEFKDAGTGATLRYNLFVPKDYDATQSYPLVLFMHDAGATSDVTTTTLYQGLGAVCWASPEDQAKRPAFVLAPQFGEIIADDNFNTSGALDTTINLIRSLAGKYSIDQKRLYTTGQSGGCMMSIAMNLKYPDFFAAAFLVAGQWDPAVVAPLAKKKLWILVSEDDNKAFPMQIAMSEVMETAGAKISRAVWNGTWNPEQYQFAFDDIDAEASPINFTVFDAGTVIPPGETSAGASGHRNTWRVAYSIEPIREWIFRQHNSSVG